MVHEVDRAYGAPRITAELNDGVPPEERVNRKRIARVMAEHDIAGIRLRRRVRTTIPEPSDQKVPDLLKRDLARRDVGGAMKPPDAVEGADVTSGQGDIRAVSVLRCRSGGIGRGSLGRIAG